MSLQRVVTESFNRSFELYEDLAEKLTAEILDSKLPNIPSNSVGLQLWCVVGARESYAAAIRDDKNIQFACSLQSTTDSAAVTDALKSSASMLLDVLKLFNSFSDHQNRLMIDLLEHESAHQGQLIRYLYALKLDIPESWKTRYSLS